MTVTAAWPQHRPRHATTGRPTSGHLLVHQLRYEMRAVRRNPTLIGFTLGMPLVMLAIFAQLLGEENMRGLGLAYKQYLAPRMIVLAILSSSFVSLASTVALRRGNGELKTRARHTDAGRDRPRGRADHRSAQPGECRPGDGRRLDRVRRGAGPTARHGRGAARRGRASAALGLAVATLIRRPENSIAITNGLLWPVVFISGTYMWVARDSALAGSPPSSRSATSTTRPRRRRPPAAAPSPGGTSSWSPSGASPPQSWRSAASAGSPTRRTDPPARPPDRSGSGSRHHRVTSPARSGFGGQDSRGSAAT